MFFRPTISRLSKPPSRPNFAGSQPVLVGPRGLVPPYNLANWGTRSLSARRAGIRTGSVAPAGIVIAPPVSTRELRNGCCSKQIVCCPLNTFSSRSPFLTSCVRCCAPAQRKATKPFSRRGRRRSAHCRAPRSGSVLPMSDFWESCTRGVEIRWSFILTSTSLSPVEESAPTERSGSPHDRGFSSPRRLPRQSIVRSFARRSEPQGWSRTSIRPSGIGGGRSTSSRSATARRS